MKQYLFCLTLLTALTGYTQEYRKGESFLMHTTQVLPDMYSPVTLPESMLPRSRTNRFDPQNPYTYVELIYDRKQKPYQVLYQTDFMGKIQFLACSNNLLSVFNRKDKPMYFFHHCLRRVNEAWSPLQISEQVMDCVINRLNQCSGP